MYANARVAAEVSVCGRLDMDGHGARAAPRTRRTSTHGEWISIAKGDNEVWCLKTSYEIQRGAEEFEEF